MIDGKQMYEFIKKYRPNDLGTAIIDYVEQLKADKQALEEQLTLTDVSQQRETVANKENKDFFKWVESEKIERISDFYFLIGDKKHTYNYVKKKYRMYLQKKQMFY
jgi:hypothetical protein|tara:strand:+ start:721 stop:1038 length:318 start_codon:yes stop_codon:yes gene_type:complete